jgi:hypothetical protein
MESSIIPYSAHRELPIMETAIKDSPTMSFSSNPESPKMETVIMWYFRPTVSHVTLTLFCLLSHWMSHLIYSSTDLYQIYFMVESGFNGHYGHYGKFL